jgi:hypothetical protein
MTSARLAGLMSRMAALPPPTTAAMRWSVEGMGWDMVYLQWIDVVKPPGGRGWRNEKLIEWRR